MQKLKKEELRFVLKKQQQQRNFDKLKAILISN